MNKNYINLLIGVVLLFTSCTQEDPEPDPVGAVLGSFTQWEEVIYDKDGVQTGSSSFNAAIDLRKNPTNSSGLNVFIDDVFKVGLIDATNSASGVYFSVYSSGDYTGSPDLLLDNEFREATYTTSSKTLEIMIRHFDGNGLISGKTKMIFKGRL